MSNLWNRPFLSEEDVLSLIKAHIQRKKPFSLIRIGDGENICLAQEGVWPIQTVLETTWAKNSRISNQKGVRLPNLRLRDKMIRAIRRATVVGIPRENDQEILTSQIYLRPLTEQCFLKYQLIPNAVCHTFVNRHLPEKKDFWMMLKGKKVILISKWAHPFKKFVQKNYPKFNISIIPIKFNNYDQIKPVLKKVKPLKADLVLVSAGVNALILVDKLAHTQNRVAIDFGKTPMLILKKNRRVNPWMPKRKKRK